MENEILTGKHLKEFLRFLGSNTLFAQCLLGIYAPTMLLLNKRIDSPLDRSLSVIIRLGTDDLDFIDSIPAGYFRTNWDAHDLIATWNDTPKKHRIKLDGRHLDIESYGHLGIITMRGYSSARKLLLDDGAVPNNKKPTRQSSAWIGILIYCLKMNKANLIEKVIHDEVRIHDVSIETILKKGWKAIEKIKD
jgi:hypothetical protein